MGKAGWERLMDEDEDEDSRRDVEEMWAKGGKGGSMEYLSG
jgi:hypothetical protein